MATAQETDAARKLIESNFDRIKSGNHYEVLGLERGASDADIKKSYFQLAKQYHSDAFSGMKLPDDIKKKADTIFGKVTEAYNVLGNAQKRQGYDDMLDSGAEGEDEAMQQAQLALRAEMEFQKAEIVVKQGNMDDAEQYLRLAIKLKADEADYWALLGWATYKKRKGDPAVNKQKGKAYLKKAVEIKPECDQAYLYMGYIAKLEDNSAIAYDMFRRALQHNEKNAAAAREAKAFESQVQRLTKTAEPEKEKKGFVGSLTSVFKKK